MSDQRPATGWPAKPIKDLNPDKEITVEPIKGLPALKDLVVDMEPFLRCVPLPVIAVPVHQPARADPGAIQSQADGSALNDTTKCILCAACTNVLPGVLVRRPVLRPAGIVGGAPGSSSDSRDRGTEQRLRS